MHNTNSFNKLLKKAEKAGCITEKKKNGLLVIAPNGERYLAHPSEKAYHPLRRFLKRFGIV